MSTLSDYLNFARMIAAGGEWNGERIIQPETLELMRTNQCAEGVTVNFPMWSMPGTGFGLGFAVKKKLAEGESDSARGEYHWGGMAGTHFWWAPKANIAGICMTQRMPGFWHLWLANSWSLAHRRLKQTAAMRLPVKIIDIQERGLHRFV